MTKKGGYEKLCDNETYLAIYNPQNMLFNE